MDRKRCRWCNLRNPRYLRYHDEEWGVPQHDDTALLELLILEPFQAGLSWETVLNKRDAFRRAFADYDPERIAAFDEVTIVAMLQDASLIRNRRKIEAAIQNARIFLALQKEWGSFSAYIWHFTQGETIYESGLSRSPLSDAIAADLKQRGMKHIGSTTVYSYLQAVGILCSHEPECFLYRSE